MKVGLCVGRADKREYYAANCRGMAAIRNIDWVEELRPGERYDLVLFQSCFNLRLIEEAKRSGAVVMLDFCDLPKNAHDRQRLRYCAKEADLLTVPTDIMQLAAEAEFRKPVFVLPDIIEYKQEWPLADPNGEKVGIVYGTSWNITKLAEYRDQIYNKFERLIILTSYDNADKPWNIIKEIISELPGSTVTEWTWQNVVNTFMQASVGIVFNYSKYGVFKHPNRIMLGLHFGLPVVAEWTPEGARIRRDVTSNVLLFTEPDEFDDKIDQAKDESKRMTKEDRAVLRSKIMQSKWGLNETIERWMDVFLKCKS